MQSRVAFQQLYDILSTIPCVVFQLLVHPDGCRQMQFIGKGIETLAGITQEEACNDIVLLEDVIVADDRPDYFCSMERAIRQLTPWQHTFRIRHRRSGDIRWICCTCRPTGLADGDSLWSGLAEDITDRKRVEDDLEQSRQRLESYLTNSPLATIEMDADFVVTRWAGEAERMFGWTEPETVGRPIMELAFVYEEDIPTVHDTIGTLLSGASRYNLTTNRNYTKDGRVITCEWYNTILTDDQGRMTSVLAQALDISQRLQAETALRESEERFRLFMDNSPTIAWLKDEEGRHLYVSKRCEERYDVPFEAWHGKTDFELWPPEVAEEFRRNDRAVLAAGGPLVVTERAIDPDGTIGYWMSTKFPFTDSSGKRYVGGIGLDITEQKRVEEALEGTLESLEQQVRERTSSLTDINERLRREIEERKRIEQDLLDYQRKLENLGLELSLATERERGRIAGELHDQVGQRLILGRMKLDALASQLPEGSNDQTIAAIRELIDSTVTDIRSMTFQLRPPILATAGLAAAVRWLGEELETQYGLQVSVHHDGSPILLSYEASYAIFQVVRELLLNVAKHAETDRAYCSLAADDGSLFIEVFDNGVGMFSDKPLDRQWQSGGFGIFSVQQRIRHLGGRLAMDPLPEGRGCRVSIIVPLASREGGDEP